MKKLWNEYRWQCIASSLLVLAPMAAGLLLWDTLPEKMATHWGADGVADGFSPRAFAVLGVPTILLALHWLCLALTCADPGNKRQSRKAMGLIFWIIPVVGFAPNGLLYAAALGKQFDTGTVTLLLIAVMLLAFGNYMPKIQRNSTLGIRLPWTVYNEDNWNATHRFASRIWVAGGLVLLFCLLLPEELMVPMLVAAVAAVAVVPLAYSYLYYRKQKADGQWVDARPSRTKGQKLVGAIGAAVGVGALAFLALMMFTGNIRVEVGEESFTVNADWYSDITVAYADIDSIEYRQDVPTGTRTNGFGSPRLCMGLFRNEEFGSYTRYSYTQVAPDILLRSGDRVLAINAASEAETEALYVVLRSKIEAPVLE